MRKPFHQSAAHLALALCCAFFAHIYAPAAQAGSSVKEALFPYLYQDEDEGVPAAFSDPADAADIALDTPHRHHDNIADWLINASSEMFSIEADTYEEHLEFLATGLNETALQQYQDFIRQSRILETLRTRNLVVRGVVTERPTLLNQAPLQGRYRWLFEVPVLLTFTPPSGVNLTTSDPVTQNIIVTLQVGRMPLGEGLEELMIENITVRRGQ